MSLTDLETKATGVERAMLRAARRDLKTGPPRPSAHCTIAVPSVLCCEALAETLHAVWRRAGVLPWSRSGRGILFCGVELVGCETVQWIDWTLQP